MADEVDNRKKEHPWRVLEFYSGIGGMRYSLLRARIDADVVEAFDINDMANDVYQHNFAHRPSQGNIQTLTSSELDKFRADAWIMSPPCQPYTRQGLQKHSADSRAFSFIKIIEIMPQLLRPPTLLFVENVVGFETSDTHMLLMKILAENKFTTQEFILSPVQFDIQCAGDEYFYSSVEWLMHGYVITAHLHLMRIANHVPISMCQTFAWAKKEPLSFRNLSFNGQLLWTTDPLLKHVNINSKDKCCQPRDVCKQIKYFLQTRDSPSQILNNGEADVTLKFKSGSTWVHGSDINVSSLKHPAEDKDNNVSVLCNINDKFSSSSLEEYSVPFSLIERWGSAMDIVFPDSKRCCCFTKSYYRYVKGTGSLLATIQPTDQSEFPSLKELGLRYFTPREVANLHSFPEDFNFPAHISLRQKYALLGNSLSVAVVAPLLEYLFTGCKNSQNQQT